MKYLQRALWALLMAYALPAMSQEVSVPDSLTATMDEVVVAANKVPETRKLVAQQMLVLNSKQIANAQAQTTADLLANTAGIFVQKSQMGGGSPVLRGFEANKILMVVDGVRMNNLIYRGGHLQNVITIDNAMLDRAEVLFGPSSTMYGSDALGGVIHFYTKQPKFATDSERLHTTANAYMRYGSVNNEVTGHADVGLGGKRLASLTSFTWSSCGDLRGGASQNPFYDTAYGVRPKYSTRIDGRDTLVANSDKYKQVQSGYSQYDVLQKFAFRQNENVLHVLNLQFSTSTNIPRYDRLTDPAPGGGLRSAEWYYGPQQRAMASYTITRDEKNAFFQHRQVLVSYQDIVESRHNRNFGSNNLAHRTERVGVFGLNLDMQRTTGSHTFRLGVEQQSNWLTSKAERENIATGVRTPLDTRYPDGDNSMMNTAAYGSHTWQINDKLVLNDGLRLGVSSLESSFKDTSFFSLPFTSVRQVNFVYSGSVGLVYNPNRRTKLTGMVATGYRVPNVDDLAKVFESVPGRLIVPNAELKPEKTISGELGLTKVLAQKVWWETVVYYTAFADAIVTTPYKYNGQDSVLYNGTVSQVVANQNQQQAYIYGGTSNVRALLHSNLLLTAGVTYTYGRIKTDSVAMPLDHIPPLVLRMQLAYTRNKLVVDVIVNAHGAKKLSDYNLGGEDNQQYATPDGMPAWVTGNVRVRYKLHKNITIMAGVDNMMDTQYRVFASGINGAGRNVFGVVRFGL
jgi:hemoglobin/transferrin/lactoferrin receptor protein